MAKVAPGTEPAALTPEMVAMLMGMLKKSAPSKGKKGRKSASSPELKAQRMAENDAECIKVFTAAGFKDVRPRVNVLTYGKIKPDGTVTGWLGQGRRVKKTEKSHKVNGFSLFHIDQTEKIGEAAVEPVIAATPTVEPVVDTKNHFNWNS